MKGFIENLTIGKKLSLYIFTTGACFLVILMLFIAQNRSAAKQFSSLTGTDIPLLSNLQELYAQGLQMGQATRNALINPKDEKARQNYRNAANAFGNSLMMQYGSTVDPILRNLHESDRGIQS